MNQIRHRDEREAAVDQAADRLSYLVVSFGLLGLVAYRSFVDGVASWELLGLVLVGGLAGTLYRIRERTVTRGWMLLVGATALAALVVAAVIASGIRP